MLFACAGPLAQADPEKVRQFSEFHISSTPAVGPDGTVYALASGLQGELLADLLALNPDGSEKWRASVSENLASSPSVGADGTIYVGGSKAVYAFDPNGSQLWEFPTGGPVYATPAMSADGMIYFGSWDKNFYAVRPDGTQAWELPLGLRAHEAAAIGLDGDIYFVTEEIFTNQNKLYAVHPDGTVKWTLPLHGDFAAGPVIGGAGELYYVSSSTLHAVLPEGTEAWRFPLGSGAYDPATIGVDGTIYVGTFQNKLYAINPDGSLKWEFNAESMIRSSPLIDSAGTIYVTGNEVIYALNADGSLQWSFPAGQFSPVMSADGALYFPSYLDGGTLFVYETGRAPANSPWPMLGQNAQHTGRAAGKTALKIVAHPQSQTVPEGSDVAFSIEVSSLEPVQFQWRHNGTAISGAVSSEFHLRLVRPEHAGIYDVLISYLDGSVISAAATLTVIDSAPFVRRDLPAGFHQGGSFLVALTADPAENITTYGVEDHPPAGWKISKISHGGRHDGDTGKVKFGPFTDNAPRLLTYQLTAPVRGEAIVNAFSGTASAEGVSSPIIGDSAIDLASVFHPADLSPADNEIRIEEVTAYATAWKEESSWLVPPNPIPNDYVTRAADLWKGGERYVYDGTKNNEALRWLNPSNPRGATTHVDGSDAPARLAQVSDSAPPPAPEILWTYALGNDASSPAIAPDGTIYISTHRLMSSNNGLFAIGPDGVLKWQTSGGSSFFTPTIAPDGTIYAGSSNDRFNAYELDGSLKWSFNALVTGAAALGSDGTIFIRSNRLIAIDPDGTEKWSLAIRQGNPQVAIGPGDILYVIEETGIFGPGATRLNAINSEGGIEWFLDLPPDQCTAPVVGHDGTIYFGQHHMLRAVAPDGLLLWEFDTGGYAGVAMSPSIGPDGTIYIGNLNGELVAVRPDGAEKWRFNGGSSIRSAPAIAADGTIYVNGADHAFALNADGTLNWRMDFGGVASPAISPDGTVYFSSRMIEDMLGGAGFLHAVSGASPAAVSPWPMFAGNAQRSGRAGGQIAFVFTEHPESLELSAGLTAEFTVSAESEEPLEFQWRRNGAAIPGATEAVLAIHRVGLADAGTYDVQVRNSKGQSISAAAQLIVTPSIPFVERMLPPAFHPGQAFPILLQTEPRSSSQVHAVEEQPPAGWTVSGISHGGVFDPLTKKVKFGPFFDDVPRQLSYELTPPLKGEAKVNRFAGTGSVEGLNSPVTGENAIDLETLPHPADLSPADSALTLDEVAAYAAAWRNGDSWPVDPNPIPMNYVSRAAALWKGGESYLYDASKKNPALRWINPGPPWGVGPQNFSPQNQSSPRPLSPDAGGDPDDPAPPGSAKRILPANFSAGEPFQVAIQILPDSAATAYVAQDTPPADWIVSQISHDGKFDPVHQQVKWGPFYDNEIRTLTYQAAPAPGAAASLEFDGAVSFDGISAPVPTRTETGTAPRFSNFTWTAAGSLQFELAVEPGAEVRVETSEDLVTWTLLQQTTSSSGQIQIEDPQSSNRPKRFYRVEVLSAPQKD